ncbi:hypothetical protein TIFTF001_046260 [Ficus carica]|uniref:Uncharacterized protein n=1 Tax=Ficus carica TaxID=3494 RepID=A0AA87Z9H5_FICCA|nr:hypothetical protein TIFTF001_046260 [Ficus carica]
MGGGRRQKLNHLSLLEREELKAVNGPPAKQQMTERFGVRGNSKIDSSTWAPVGRKTREKYRSRGTREQQSYREHGCTINPFRFTVQRFKGRVKLD